MGRWTDRWMYGWMVGLGIISNISDNIAIIMMTMSNLKISWISNISNSSILSQKNVPNVQYYVPLSSLLPRERREVPFISAVDSYQDFKSPNQSFPVTRIHFLPGVLFILSNLATMRTCGSAAADDLKTPTNKAFVSMCILVLYQQSHDTMRITIQRPRYGTALNFTSEIVY